MDAVLAFLANPAVLSVAAILIESLFRLIPSEKPLSILHLVASVMKGAGDFLDKVLPQNLKKT